MELRPSSEFNYEAGKNKLINVHLPSDDGHPTFITPGNADNYEGYDERYQAGFTGRQGKFLRLSGRVDLESRLSVGCACAVLSYLSRRKAVEYLPGDADANLAFRILTIESFSLNETM
jgi:DNA mismatch repair protein MSH5